MSEDARFEDGEDKALNIGAFDKSDLEIVSSLIQDSILPTNEIKWLPTTNKLALLINRFRWEGEVCTVQHSRIASVAEAAIMRSTGEGEARRRAGVARRVQQGIVRMGKGLRCARGG